MLLALGGTRQCPSQTRFLRACWPARQRSLPRAPQLWLGVQRGGAPGQLACQGRFPVPMCHPRFGFVAELEAGAVERVEQSLLKERSPLCLAAATPAEAKAPPCPEQDEPCRAQQHLAAPAAGACAIPSGL